MFSEYLPLDALATRLGLPRTWLKREADSGRLPYVQAGAHRRFDEDQVREHLRQQAERNAEALRGQPA